MKEKFTNVMCLLKAEFFPALVIACLLMMLPAMVIILLFHIYLLTTRFWWFTVLYLFWIYYDRKTSETGGRPLAWVQSWKFWDYMIDYQPSKIAFAEEFELDPKRNYMFSCFPHAIAPGGPLCIPLRDAHGLLSKYPSFKISTAASHYFCFIPFLRELLLGMGFISHSAKSINYILSRPEGSHIVILLPGAGAEAKRTLFGRYRFVLKDKKGFVKVALRNGAPLVPVISFGETERYHCVELRKFRILKEYVQKIFGSTFIFVYGRWFTFMPLKTPVTVLLGNPIDVDKTENPTQHQLDELHEKFIQQLKDLFDKYKYKYLEKPEERFLEIE